MAYLAKARKDDLKTLATELGLEIGEMMRVIDFKNVILTSKDYDEQFTKTLSETIIETRVQAERDEKEENDYKRKQEGLILELERMKLSMTATSTNICAAAAEKINIQHLIPRFVENSDISTYLKIFERQCEQVNIGEVDYVTHLLPMLPIDISHIILREPKDKLEHYQHIKQLLLQRFQLSAESFRRKFSTPQKQPEALWKDFAYELNNYLEGWLHSLEVKDFNSPKDLVLTEQLKKRVSKEVQHSSKKTKLCGRTSQRVSKEVQYSSKKQPEALWKDFAYELNNYLEGWLHSLEVKDFNSLRIWFLPNSLRKEFRRKFSTPQKQPEALWKDFAYELNNYLEGWLHSLEVKDFNSPKDLVLTEQLKKRVSKEVHLRKEFRRKFSTPQKQPEALWKDFAYELNNYLEGWLHSLEVKDFNSLRIWFLPNSLRKEFRRKFSTPQKQPEALWKDFAYELNNYLEGWLHSLEVKDFNSPKDLVLTEQLKKEFRRKFSTPQKQPEALWKDFAYELNNYLEGWLHSLEVKDFNSPKDLVLTEQLKKRVSKEVHLRKEFRRKFSTPQKQPEALWKDFAYELNNYLEGWLHSLEVKDFNSLRIWFLPNSLRKEFRRKFSTPQKQPEALWKDFAYELNNYLEGWLHSLEVKDFNSLRIWFLPNSLRKEFRRKFSTPQKQPEALWKDFAYELNNYLEGWLHSLEVKDFNSLRIWFLPNSLRKEFRRKFSTPQKQPEALWKDFALRKEFRRKFSTPQKQPEALWKDFAYELNNYLEGWLHSLEVKDFNSLRIWFLPNSLRKEFRRKFSTPQKQPEALWKDFALRKEFRRKFSTPQKQPEALWKDFAYELNNYLEGWLHSLEVKDFNSPKDLVLTEQLKKRVSKEVQYSSKTTRSFVEGLRTLRKEFRRKFSTPQKQPEALWKDFAYELNNYLEGWLHSLEVKDFNSPKDLVLTEQLKKRVSRRKFSTPQKQPEALWKDFAYELNNYLEGWLHSLEVKDFNSPKDLVLTEQLKKEFRRKFSTPQKQPEALWKDFAYELNNYLEGWLHSLEVKDFNSPKDLVLTEQLKKEFRWNLRKEFRRKFSTPQKQPEALWKDFAYELNNYLEGWLHSLEVKDCNSPKDLVLTDQLKKEFRRKFSTPQKQPEALWKDFALRKEFRRKFSTPQKQPEALWKDFAYELNNYLEGWLHSLEVKDFNSLRIWFLPNSLRKEFRRKFSTPQKQPEALWKDFAYELNNYLEGWLHSLEVKDFNSPKDLVLTEQLKKRVSKEVQHSQKQPEALWKDFAYELNNYLEGWLHSLEVKDCNSPKDLVLTDQLKKRVSKEVQHSSKTTRSFVEGLRLKKEFRRKFSTPQKQPEALWKDFAYELNNYLEGWLHSLEVKDCNSPKDLVLTDQLKKRVSKEVQHSSKQPEALWKDFAYELNNYLEGWLHSLEVKDCNSPRIWFLPISLRKEFRRKFSTPQKQPEALWKDFAYELNNYLEGWLHSLEVKDCNSPKDLVLTDQLKKRVSKEVQHSSKTTRSFVEGLRVRAK
ncbi:retrovirus-related Pol polyprotein from transposon 17.6 [Trichonephila clavipes]|nr:retrovirus-related Pol polyprotein from transposon 17.6 [Trichonephila clavipes]